MGVFEVKRSLGARPTIKNGVDTLIIFAADADAAVAMADTWRTGESSWADSTARWLRDDVIGQTNGPLTGWYFEIKVRGANKDLVVSYTAGASDDIDSVAYDLRDQLNALEDISNAAYADTGLTQPQKLTVAGAADGIGDRKVEVTVLPSPDLVIRQEHYAPMVTDLVHQGDAGDELSFYFPSDFHVPALVTAALGG